MNKVIFSMKIMMALVERGFIPISQMPNPKHPEYMCWIFQVTPDFQLTLDEILGGKKDG